jgi:hypothetical protein
MRKVIAITALMSAFACANTRKDTGEPNNACVRSCEQDKCAYQAAGDDDSYLECLDSCIQECG